MKKHTPGPWEVWEIEQDFDTVVQKPGPDVTDPDEDELLICEVRNPQNARLIAAAPELLEACEYAADTLAGGPTRSDSQRVECLKIVLGAISKAKGE